MTEILLSLSGRKIPVEIEERFIESLKTSNSELQLMVKVFSDGFTFKPANDDKPDEVVYKGKIVAVLDVK